MTCHIPAWKDGDILKAQHFQALYETLEAFASRPFALHPYGYGVKEIKIDDSRIQDNVLAVYKLAAVFRDGTFVSQDCSIEAQVPEEGNQWFVYVGLTAKEGDYSMRYEDYVTEIKDWYEPQRAYIQCIKHRLHLFIDEKPPIGYSCLPVAKIASKRVDQSYSPPLLFVDRESPIYPKLLELISFLRDKAEAISKDHQCFAGLVESLVETEVMLKSRAHPLGLYTALMKLYAKSSAFRQSKSLPEFIPYEHENLVVLYDRIGERIKKNMSNVKDVSSVVLEKKDGFFIQLKPEYQFKDQKLAISLEFTGRSQSEMDNWIVNAVIEDSNMEASNRRVLGAARTVLSKIDELGLEEKSGSLLAEVSVDEIYLSGTEILSIFNRSLAPEMMPDRIKIFFHPKKSGG